MKKFAPLLLAAALLLTLTPPADAQASGPIPITTVEQLQNINPAGSYILMNDLDLAGVDWVPLELSGSFDGNGHSLLNLTLSRVSDRQGMTFDGNWKEYDTRFCALFGFVSGTVSDLNLVNVRGLVEADGPCFLAGVAGCLDGGTVTGCSVTGTLELRAYDRCFGVGGVAGYGIGKVENCTADVTLICTDLKPEPDEQFLGGICAGGFVDVKDCTVRIDGYASEHGYAHNGGVIGMCVRYPKSNQKHATVTGNRVTGKISFFEEVASRRAYCRPIVGEYLVAGVNESGNTHDFVRDEHTDYTVELRPEMCEAPTYREERAEVLCPDFGYTLYTCQGCGYSYRDRYTLPRHTPGPWQVVTAPTQDREGLEEADCTACGLTLQQVLPQEAPPPTTQPQTPPVPTPTAAAPVEEPEGLPWYLLPAGIALCVALALVILLARPRKKGRYERR